MVKPALNNNNKNTSASVVAFRQQGKQVYANSLLNTKGLSEPCPNRVALGKAPTTSYSGMTYVDQRVGAVATTCAEKAEILASDKCSSTQ